MTWRLVVGQAGWRLDDGVENPEAGGHKINTGGLTWDEARERMLHLLRARWQTEDDPYSAAEAVSEHLKLKDDIHAPQPWRGEVEGDDWVIVVDEGQETPVLADVMVAYLGEGVMQVEETYTAPVSHLERLRMLTPGLEDGGDLGPAMAMLDGWAAAG